MRQESFRVILDLENNILPVRCQLNSFTWCNDRMVECFSVINNTRPDLPSGGFQSKQPGPGPAITQF